MNSDEQVADGSKFHSQFDEWCYRLTFDGVESEFNSSETGKKGWLVVLTPGDRLAAEYFDLHKQLYGVYAVIVVEDENERVIVKKCHSANSARIMWREAKELYGGVSSSENNP